MDFGSILKTLKDSISKPSIVGNLLTGKAWNQSIPDFGGVAPQAQMMENPNIASPLQPQDEMTKGLVYKMGVDARNEANTAPSNFQQKTVQYPEWIGNLPATASAQYKEGQVKDLTDVIKRGLEAYGNPPVTASAEALAQAGQGLPDPLMPAIMPLIETGGGRHITRGNNNIYNMLPTRAGVDYPNMETAILGGDGHQGFVGILKALYQDYLKSGDLNQFFPKYSPSSENADVPTQIKRYNDIKTQFFGQ